MLPDLYCTDLLETAMHDEIQGIEALSCAFGLSYERVETIIAEEPAKGTCCLAVKTPDLVCGF